MKGNPYPHRYKDGKMETTISKHQLRKILDNLDSANLRVGRVTFPILTVKSLIAILYWTGLRKTEVIGSVPHKYKVKNGFKWTAKVPGIVKEDISKRGRKLYVKAIARKHGKRESPLILYMNRIAVKLIAEQWRNTEEKSRVWPVDEYRCWVLLKRVGFYPHYLRFNRVTRLCEDPQNSMAEICAWTGMTPQTVGAYLARAGRYTEQLAGRMKD